MARSRARHPLLRAVVAVSLLSTLGACSDAPDRGAASPSTTTTPSTTISLPSSTRSTETTTTTVPPPCQPGDRLDRWSLERRAAQTVVLPSLDFDVDDLAGSLQAGAGGLIFLGHATAPPDLRARIAAAAGTSDPGAAPLVMADVEGGVVQRLPSAVDEFPSARELAATMTIDQVEALAQTIGQQMVAAGATVDLAPVLDLDDGDGPNRTNPDGTRSFSLDPATTSAYGQAFVGGLRAGGVAAVVKHFPGIGHSVANSDLGPAATRPWSELEGAGLLPFVDAIDNGATAVMVANSFVPGLTDDPASTSPAVVTDLLRGQLHFDGLVVSDSLSAGAITQAGYSLPEAAVAALAVGSDLILFGSTLTPAETVLLSPGNVEASRAAIVDAIVTAVDNGQLPIERLDQAVAHVLTAKGTDACAAAIET